jgi:uncharacterized protein (TIGR03435 family)
MSVLQLLAAQPWVERLGSTLLHFLWQGVVVAAVYAAARQWAARTAGPNVRYILACTALAAMAAAPVLTWAVLGPAAPAHSVAISFMTSAPTAATLTAVRNAALSFPAAVYGVEPAPLLPVVVALWLAGAMVLWLRLAGGWIFAERLRSTKVRPAPAEWQPVLERLKLRIRVSRPVRLLISALVETPCVVGWIRPVVLMPVGAMAGLPTEQVEALLLHELAHIRRHDYLVGALQGLIETLLFYHPAVWWVSGHMRAERELCCDDAAVSIAGDVLPYVCALAELESARSVRLGAVMAATGGSLVHRIGRLVGQPRPAPRSFSGAGIMAGVLLAAALALFGQPTDRPRFDAASIKPSADEGRNWGLSPRPGGLTANGNLELLIDYAYGVRDFQVVGGPEWINSERYLVDAKSVGRASRDQVRLMLQSLLEDRFQLKVHRDTRELPVFNLVMARGGPKLPAPKEGGCIDGDPPPLPNGDRMPVPGSGPVPLVRCGHLGITLEKGGARVFGGKTPVSELIPVLSTMLHRMVIDKTGLAGLFDIELHFVPDDSTASLPPPPPEAGASDPMSPPIFSALPEQLGLRLEPAKVPVEVIVIDHVERPTAN